MKFIPHEYQSRAIRWIEDHPRCLLFLEMGLGKTAVCLTGVERLRCYAEAEKVLVIAPRTVAEGTWSDEVAKWDHLTLRISNVIGTEKQRLRALTVDADVYVISRDSVIWLCEHYKNRLPFDMVIIDELTSFKNPRALRFKALKRSTKDIPRIVGLTGTPTPNGFMDLWAQVYCIDGGQRLGKYVTHYRDRYFSYVMRNNIVTYCSPKKGAREEIMDKISDIALSMRSEDWLTLPSLMVENVPVVLSEVVLKKYRAFERDKVMAITQDAPAITADSAASLLNKLSQFANGAVYIDSDLNTNADHGREFKEIHDAKLKALEDIYFSEDSPLLVFYQYQHDLHRIKKYLEGKIRGKVTEYKDWNDGRGWNEGKIRLLLAHPSSTSYGLNLQQGGHRIVWFSTGWNLEHYQQANARLYRQGQQQAVRVFNLITKGTVDERMATTIEDKNTTQKEVMKRLAAEIVAEIKSSQK